MLSRVENSSAPGSVGRVHFNQLCTAVTAKTNIESHGFLWHSRAKLQSPANAIHVQRKAKECKGSNSRNAIVLRIDQQNGSFDAHRQTQAR